MSDVFSTGCSGAKHPPGAHDIEVAAASGVAGDDRTLFCTRCGQAVPLRIAIARTPTPTVFTVTGTDSLSMFSTGGTA